VPGFEALGGVTVVVVVGAVVVVVVEVVAGDVVGVEVVGPSAGTVLGGALVPGCSFATTTPMATAAPVATKAAERVRRRRRASARLLASGEPGWGVELIGWFLASLSIHGSSGVYSQPGILLCIACE